MYCVRENWNWEVFVFFKLSQFYQRGEHDEFQLIGRWDEFDRCRKFDSDGIYINDEKGATGEINATYWKI